MNHDLGDQALQWSGMEQLDGMASMQDVDFSNFLDIGDLDLTAFSPLGHESQSNTNAHDNATAIANANANANANAPHDMSQMSDSQSLQHDAMIHDYAADPFELPMAMDQEETFMSSHDIAGQDSHAFGQTGNNVWPQEQHFHNQSMQTQPYHPPQHVPPTPNSYEMHGNPGRYLQQQMDPQTRSFLEQRYQLKKDEAASFTPLVSPAVTPQDSRFQPVISEYTVPGAYFSPLTSPALQAQNAQTAQQFYNYNANPSTAASSVATSPIDLNMDVDMTGNNPSLPDNQRKARRKMQPPRSTGPSARVRQSPIVKPQQKRKSTHMSTVIPSKDVQNILREAQMTASPPASATFRNVASIESSGTDSTSPEPLSESVMGPPPRPVSARQSPALRAQTQSAPASAVVNGNSGAPATPASLMSLKRSRQLAPSNGAATAPDPFQPSAQTSDDFAMLDDFALPPAANSDVPRRTGPERIIMSKPVVSADATPRMVARKTPNIAPAGTPMSALQPLSATSSPAVSAMPSPAIAATPSGLSGRKLDSKTPKSGKKRNSVTAPGSVLISPAIRPKISPSIKPLLPDGARLNESQQALLLASKSNYTHILEGTLLPGVTYPESLSSGLTSKRTSHKIAEQGRRNRINEALKEMQALLPRPGSGSNKSADGSENRSTESLAVADDEDGEKDGSKSASASADSKSANSKAATVESAIEYIKALQHERLQMAHLLKAKDADMAVLRQRLQEAQLASSSSTESLTQQQQHQADSEIEGTES